MQLLRQLQTNKFRPSSPAESGPRRRPRCLLQELRFMKDLPRQPFSKPWNSSARDNLENLMLKGLATRQGLAVDEVWVAAADVDVDEGEEQVEVWDRDGRIDYKLPIFITGQ